MPAAYFLDDTVAERVDARLSELKGSAGAAALDTADELEDVLADSNIRAVAFRLAGLSPRALKGLRAIVDQVRAVEGLPEVGRSRRGRNRG